MDRWIRILGIVLSVQVVLAVLVWWGGGEPEPAGGERFLAWAPEDVTEIRIAPGGQEDQEGQGVTLRRQGEGWVVARLDDLPAAGERIGDLLQKLHESRLGLPVGTTAATQKRFKVADEAFGRRLELKNRQGGERVLYVGESAGPGRVYARLEGQDAIHELPVRRYELGTRPVDWADRELLHLDPADIRKVALDDLVLVHGDQGWTLADAKPDEHLDSGKVQRLIDQLTRLNFIDVVPEAEARKGEPLMTVRVERKSGPPVEYRIFTRTGDEQGLPQYVLEIEGKPWHFVLSGHTVARLVEADRDSLLSRAEKKAGGEQEQASPATDNASQATDND